MSRPSHVSERSLQRSEFERAAHNTDFCRLRISKNPANAQEMKYFFTLVIDWNGFGEIIIRWKRGKSEITDIDYDCIMIMYVQCI